MFGRPSLFYHDPEWDFHWPSMLFLRSRDTCTVPITEDMTSVCLFGLCDFDSKFFNESCDPGYCGDIQNDTSFSKVFTSAGDTCTSMDVYTCEETFWKSEPSICNDNFTYEYDEDGCFNFELVKASCFYQDYLRVKLYLGVIGKGLYCCPDMNVKPSNTLWQLNIFHFIWDKSFINHFAVVGSIGLLGNILNLLVLNSRELRNNCFNNLLTCLNIVERWWMVIEVII